MTYYEKADIERLISKIISNPCMHERLKTCIQASIRFKTLRDYFPEIDSWGLNQRRELCLRLQVDHNLDFDIEIRRGRVIRWPSWTISVLKLTTKGYQLKGVTV